MVLHHSIVGGFGLGGRYVADGLEQPTIVEPVDPFEGGILDRFERAPGTLPPDDLGLVETVDRKRFERSTALGYFG